MKKRKLGLAAVIGLSSLAAAFLACQSDVTDPTPAELHEDGYYPAIYGYCIDELTNQPIYMAKVTWVSPFGVMGYCISRWDGWYRIMDVNEEWGPLEGEDLDGDAEHILEIYNPAYNDIEDFNPELTYRRDFEMEPDPGQGTITKHGGFNDVYVRDSGTGDGIYPACVTIRGYDGAFLGYDTT